MLIGASVISVLTFDNIYCDSNVQTTDIASSYQNMDILWLYIFIY